MNIFKSKKHIIWTRLITSILITAFLCQNVVFASEELNRNCLAVQSRLIPFFEGHGLDIGDIGKVVMSVSGLKDVIKGDCGRDIEEKIKSLNQFLSDRKIKIEGTGEYSFKCSQRKIKYALFNFEEKGVMIKSLFIDPTQKLTSPELEELGIKDEEKHHLDCPGLEGVWFVEQNAVITKKKLPITEMTTPTGANLAVYEDYDGVAYRMARETIDIIKKDIAEGKKTVITLFTGSTSIGVYKWILEIAESEKVDFSNVYFFHLDEYYVGTEYKGDWRENMQSYAYFLNTHFFNPLEKLRLGLNRNNIYFHEGQSGNVKEAMRLYNDVYEKAKSSAGSVVVLDGIGEDGHVAFIEPKYLINKKFAENIDNAYVTDKLRRFNEFIIGEGFKPGEYENVIKAVLLARAKAMSGEVFVDFVKEEAVKAYEENRGKEDAAVLADILNGQTMTFYVKGLSALDVHNLEGIAADFKKSGGINFNVEFVDFEQIQKAGIYCCEIAFNTIRDNARFFPNFKDVPTRAVTMGFPAILGHTTKVMVAASGRHKSRAICKAVLEKPSYEAPISFVATHKNNLFIADKKAAEEVLDKNRDNKNKDSDRLGEDVPSKGMPATVTGAGNEEIEPSPLFVKPFWEKLSIGSVFSVIIFALSIVLIIIYLLSPHPTVITEAKRLCLSINDSSFREVMCGESKQLASRASIANSILENTIRDNRDFSAYFLTPPYSKTNKTFFIGWSITRMVTNYSNGADVSVAELKATYKRVKKKELDEESERRLRRFVEIMYNPSTGQHEFIEAYDDLITTVAFSGIYLESELNWLHTYSLYGAGGNEAYIFIRLLANEEQFKDLRSDYSDIFRDFKIILDFFEGRINFNEEVRAVFERSKEHFEKIEPYIKTSYEQYRAEVETQVMQSIADIYKDISLKELIEWFNQKDINIHLGDGMQNEGIQKMYYSIMHSVFDSLPEERTRGLNITFINEGLFSHNWYDPTEDMFSFDILSLLNVTVATEFELESINSIIVHELAHRWYSKQLDEEAKKEFADISYPDDKTVHRETPFINADIHRDFIKRRSANVTGSSEEDLANSIEGIYYDNAFYVERGIRNLLEHKDPDLAQKVFFTYAFFEKVASEELWLIRVDDAPVNQDIGTYAYKDSTGIYEVKTEIINDEIILSKRRVEEDFNPDTYVRKLVARSRIRGPISKDKGTPATLLKYMYENKIFSDNPKKSREMAGQREGNDSQRTIQRELKVLKAVGLVEGNSRTGYYLAEWLRDKDIEEIIKENPELNIAGPSQKQIDAVKERIKRRGEKEADPLSAFADSPRFEEVRKIVEALGEEYKRNEDHGLNHALALIKTAEALAEKRNITDQINWKRLTAAILLHDVTADLEEKHGETGATVAGEILSRIGGYSADEIDKIKEDIVLHEVRTPEGSRRREETGLESQFLNDCDQIDAFGMRGIYRYLIVYFKRGKNLQYIKDKVYENNRERYRTLHFDESRQMAEINYCINLSFFRKLQEETYSEDSRLGATGVAYFINRFRNFTLEEIAKKATAELRELRPMVQDKDLGDYYYTLEYFNFVRKIKNRDSDRLGEDVPYKGTPETDSGTVSMEEAVQYRIHHISLLNEGSFNPSDAEVLRGHKFEPIATEQLEPLVYEEAETQKLFFAYPKRRRESGLIQKSIFDNAKKAGIDNLVETRAIGEQGEDPTIYLTMVAQTYTDSELEQSHTQAEDLLLTMIYFCIHDPRITDNNNLECRSIGGKLHYLVFDYDSGLMPFGINALLPEEYRNIFANQFRKVELDRQYIEKRISELNITRLQNALLTIEIEAILHLIKMGPDQLLFSVEEPRGENNYEDLAKDISSTFILLDNILNKSFKENRKYKIRYDLDRLSSSQVKIIEQYLEAVRGKLADPKNIEIQPFRSTERDYLIRVECYTEHGQLLGEGQIDIGESEKLDDYSLRMIGMLNIVFSTANVENQYNLDEPLIRFIKEQYKLITGVDPLDNFDIRNIILPRPEKLDLSEADRLNKLAVQVLISA